MRLPALVPALVLALLLVSAGGAHAQSTVASVLTTPPPGDIWRHLLELMFPGVGPLSGTATQGSSAFASAISAFIAVLMLAGAATLAWHIMQGVVESAHEGTALGRRFHQVWSPVRVVVGFGLLAPVAGGFCIAQVLVITVACWSGSFGNFVWSAYLEGLTTPSLSAPSLPATGAVAKAFANAEICHAALSQKRVENGLPALPAVAESQSNLSSGAGLAVTAGNSWSYLTSWVSGGSSASAAQSNRTMVGWDYGPCGAISVPLALNAGGDPLVTTFDTTRLKAFDNLRGAMKSAAESFVASMSSGSASPSTAATSTAAATSAIVNAKARFDAALTAASSAVVSTDNSGALSAFTTNANGAGWVSAGAFYPTLSRLQARVQQVADTIPALTFNAAGSDADSDEASVLKELHASQSGIISRFESAYDTAATGWSSGSVPDLSAGVKAGADGASSASVAGVLNWVFRTTFSAVDTYVSGVSANLNAGSPLQQMTSFGSQILSAATAVLLVGIPAMYFAGGSFAALLGAGGVLGYAVTLATAIAAAVLAVGVGHAYVIPMMPFVFWTFAVLQTLMLVAEAVVAAPLWALVHIRMDGNELVGPEQRAGYTILLSLFLRIPLLLFGLFLSMSVFQGGIWLLSVTFYPAMLSATADSSAGLVGAVVMLIMAGFLHWHLALRSFSLITALPDRVMRWLGAAGDGATEERPASDVRALLLHSSQSAARNALTAKPAGRSAAPPGSPGVDALAPVGRGGAPVAGAVQAGAEAVEASAGTHERSELSVHGAQPAPAATRQAAGEHSDEREDHA